ncbi:hypothetical protein [Geodermatophilus sp. SYSU D01036]
MAFPDRGHSLGADSGWEEVAGTVLAFLARHGVGAPSPEPVEGVHRGPGRRRGLP